MNAGKIQEGVEPRKFPASLFLIRDDGMHEAFPDCRLHSVKYPPVGIDIAKHLIQIYSINGHTGEVVDKQLHRQDFLPFFNNWNPA